MKSIVYAGVNEVIEISFPDWLTFIMKRISRYLKVQTIEKIPSGKGQKIDWIIVDESA